MRQSPNIFDFFFIDKKMFIIDPINFSNGLFLQYKKISKKEAISELMCNRKFALSRYMKFRLL